MAAATAELASSAPPGRTASWRLAPGSSGGGRDRIVPALGQIDLARADPTVPVQAGLTAQVQVDLTGRDGSPRSSRHRQARSSGHGEA